MDEMTAIRAFVHAVERGTLSDTAKHMGLSVSTVSRHLNALEESLKVRLLNRSTRHIGLTEAGRQFYEHAHAMLDRYEQGRQAVAATQTEVKGVLRVHMLTAVAHHNVAPALPAFLKAHPELVLDITLTDERADLIAESIDVAVWIGELADSNMIARKLRPSQRMIVGTPAYFAEHGVPLHPRDLYRHNCLRYRNPRRNVWRFQRDNEALEIVVPSNLQANSGPLLLNCALQSLGLAMLHETTVRAAIQSGQLRAVLTDWSMAQTERESSLYAVYPHSRSMSPKVRAFIDFLVQLFRDDGGADVPARS